MSEISPLQITEVTKSHGSELMDVKMPAEQREVHAVEPIWGDFFLFLFPDEQASSKGH